MKRSFTSPFIIPLGGFLFGFTTLCGQTLENRSMRIDISAMGNIKTIYDVSGKHEYKVETDFFTVVTDWGSLSNKDAMVLQTKKGEGWIAYYYQLSPSRMVKLEYTLKPEAAYIERSLTVSEGSEPLALLNIEFGVTRFSNAPEEVIIYNTFWNASTVSFLRWKESGVFCGLKIHFLRRRKPIKLFHFNMSHRSC